MEEEIKYEYFEPEMCWYCHTRGQGLSEHHLWRGWKREKSPTVWLCYKCHQKATWQKWFEVHLQKLWIKLNPKLYEELKRSDTNLFND